MKTSQHPSAVDLRPWGALLVGLFCLAVLYVSAVGLDRRYFQLSNDTAVEILSLDLPLRYRLEYWRYTPEGPVSGVRLLQDEPPLTSKAD